MDLSKLDTVKAADEGADLELLFDDKPILDEKTGQPWTIRLLGADSKEFMKISHKLQEKRLQRRFKGGKQKFSLEELDADSMELLVACTKGWKHLQLDGAPVVFNDANVKMVYTRFPWIREQVDTFVNDRSNFLGESSKS